MGSCCSGPDRFGVPFADLVRFLGTMVGGHSTPLVWWRAGLAFHASVGAVWAIFYAYFFWHRDLKTGTTLMR